MITKASQITSLTIVYSNVYSDADQRKHQSSASLAFVWGILRDRWISRTKGQLRGKCFHLMTTSWEANTQKKDAQCKCCHFDEGLVTGCTESCQRCCQWWGFRQNDCIETEMILTIATFETGVRTPIWCGVRCIHKHWTFPNVNNAENFSVPCRKHDVLKIVIPKDTMHQRVHVTAWGDKKQKCKQ